MVCVRHISSQEEVDSPSSKTQEFEQKEAISIVPADDGEAALFLLAISWSPSGPKHFWKFLILCPYLAQAQSDVCSEKPCAPSACSLGNMRTLTVTLPLPEGLLVFCEAAQYHMLCFALLRQRSVHDPLALSLVRAHIVTKERFTQLCLMHWISYFITLLLGILRRALQVHLLLDLTLKFIHCNDWYRHLFMGMQAVFEKLPPVFCEFFDLNKHKWIQLLNDMNSHLEKGVRVSWKMTWTQAHTVHTVAVSLPAWLPRAACHSSRSSPGQVGPGRKWRGRWCRHETGLSEASRIQSSLFLPPLCHSCSSPVGGALSRTRSIAKIPRQPAAACGSLDHACCIQSECYSGHRRGSPER